MSDNPAEAGNSVTVSNVSGGVNLDAQRDVTIGGDVVGRDKITQTLITEEVAYNVAGLENPYLGLKPFTYDERDRYAGRDDEIADTVSQLTAPGAPQGLLFVTGASGSGKSSFVQAGLLPRLEAWYRQCNQVVKRAVFRPANAPLDMLQDALAQLGAGVTRLSDLAALNQINLIVLDQFEEAFTQTEAGPRQDFFALLAALPPFQHSHTHLIATLRSDYLKELFEVKPLWEVAIEGVPLRAMSADSLRQAILKPLQAKYPDKRMEPELLDALAHDAAENVTYLPLLQVTLQELWKNGRLKRAGYTTLADAIKERAETVYGYTDHARQSPRRARPTADQDTLLKIFLDLVQVSADDNARHDVRQRQAKTDLVGDSLSRAHLIEELVGARLLSVTIEAHGAAEVEYVEVIHEALIREWGRLQQAIKDNREQLRWRQRFEQSLREWEQAGRDDAHALPQVRLNEARQLRERDDIVLRTEAAQALLRRSEEKLEADLRREREQTEQLRKALASARARELARIAISQQDVDQARALLIALEAARSHPGAAAEDALRRTLLTHAERAILRGHEGDVRSAQFSPDGLRVVTASADKTARVWETDTGRELRALRGHENGVTRAQFSSDGLRIVTFSEDKTVRVWDAGTGKELAVLRGHEFSVRNVQFSPDDRRIVTFSEDKTARVWDAGTGKELAILRGHTSWVYSVQFSPDGRCIVTGSFDKTARVWDANTGRELAVLRGHEGEVNSAQFSPDGSRVVTASGDKTARVWDVGKGKELAVLRGHEGEVINVKFSPDALRVVTASNDGTARVWDVGKGKELAVLRGHESVVSSVQFSPDAVRVVTASDDKTARVWDADTGREFAALRGHDGPVWDAQFSPDGMRIITAGDVTARVWATDTSKERVSVLRGHEGDVNSAQFSRDSHRIVTANADGTVRMWDADTGRELAVLRGHEKGVSGVQFSPDGRRIVTTSVDKTARVWDADTGRELAVLRGHTGWVLDAQFSPDALRVVTASSDKTVRVWEADTGREGAALHGHERNVYSAQFSPDSRRIVTASEDKTARVWDTGTGKELAVLRGHEGDVHSAQFSPDSRRIVTASDDQTARVWDADTGSELAVLHGHDASVRSAQFSPDGSRIVTGSYDKTGQGGTRIRAKNWPSCAGMRAT